MKAEEHSCFIQREILSCSQHSYFGTCPFEEGRGSLLAHDIYSVWCNWAFKKKKKICLWSLINSKSDLVYPELLVTLFILFILSSWAQGIEYLQQVTQSTASAGTCYQRLYFLPVLGNPLLVKEVSQLILSCAALWLRLGHHRNIDSHRETDLQNQQTSWGKDSAQWRRCPRYCSSCAINWTKNWWIFTHNICWSNLLCETHGWIFTHNVRRESLTMIKSWVSFHPQSTPCKCYYVKVMG